MGTFAKGSKRVCRSDDGGRIPTLRTVLDKGAFTPHGIFKRFGGRLQVCWYRDRKSVAVHFASDSYTRIYESLSLLDSIATSILELLKDDPDITIVLKGHSDSRGDEEYNTWLSERRAKTIAQYLIKRGIPRDRIVVEAYGENFPVASNLTPEGRRLNRRVEIVIHKPNRPTFEGYLRFLGLKDP